MSARTLRGEEREQVIADLESEHRRLLFDLAPAAQDCERRPMRQALEDLRPFDADDFARALLT